MPRFSLAASARFHEDDTALLGMFLEGAFASATGVNLRLNDGDRATKSSIGGGGFVGCAGDNASWNAYTAGGQQLFRLIFVNFHCRSCRDSDFPVVRA